MKKIDNLPVFTGADSSVREYAERALQSSHIKKVVCCALGPSGTNIEQAAKKWLARVGVVDKSEVILGDTPEKCLQVARDITAEGVVAVFWTCAVYYNENLFFFGNPDVYPFFFQEDMLLDSMQLAARSFFGGDLNPDVHPRLTVASHPSPAPLVAGFGEVVLCNSNAAAAKMCAEGKTDLCITTESARKIHGLVELHSFGCPLMVFFGGVTQHGLKQIENASTSLV